MTIGLNTHEPVMTPKNFGSEFFHWPESMELPKWLQLSALASSTLFKKLRQSSEVKDTLVRDPDVESPPSFVQVPLSSSGRQITLELPHQIKLSIQL